MSRTLLVWSLLLGLALVGADWYVERPPVAAPSGAEGRVTTMEDGVPIPPPN